MHFGGSTLVVMIDRPEFQFSAEALFWLFRCKWTSVSTKCSCSTIELLKCICLQAKCGGSRMPLVSNQWLLFEQKRFSYWSRQNCENAKFPSLNVLLSKSFSTIWIPPSFHVDERISSCASHLSSKCTITDSYCVSRMAALFSAEKVTCTIVQLFPLPPMWGKQHWRSHLST